jgi:hypothetical protein
MIRGQMGRVMKKFERMMGEELKGGMKVKKIVRKKKRRIIMGVCLEKRLE